MGNSFGFGERLRLARIAAGLSGTQLGLGAGEHGKDASKASVSDWENERHYPKMDQLRVICLKLNISADDLIFGDIKKDAKSIEAERMLLGLTQEQREKLLDRMTPEGVARGYAGTFKGSTLTQTGRARAKKGKKEGG